MMKKSKVALACGLIASMLSASLTSYAALDYVKFSEPVTYSLSFPAAETDNYVSWANGATYNTADYQAWTGDTSAAKAINRKNGMVILSPGSQFYQVVDDGDGGETVAVVEEGTEGAVELFHNTNLEIRFNQNEKPGRSYNRISASVDFKVENLSDKYAMDSRNKPTADELPYLVDTVKAGGATAYANNHTLANFKLLGIDQKADIYMWLFRFNNQSKNGYKSFNMAIRDAANASTRTTASSQSLPGTTQKGESVHAYFETWYTLETAIDIENKIYETKVTVKAVDDPAQSPDTVGEVKCHYVFSFPELTTYMGAASYVTPRGTTDGNSSISGISINGSNVRLYMSDVKYTTEAVKVTKPTIEKNENTYTATVPVRGNITTYGGGTQIPGEVNSPVAFLAAYDADGKLVGVDFAESKSLSITGEARDTTKNTGDNLTAAVTNAAAASAKLFVWNNASALMPAYSVTTYPAQ